MCVVVWRIADDSGNQNLKNVQIYRQTNNKNSEVSQFFVLSSLLTIKAAASPGEHWLQFFIIILVTNQ